MNETETNMRMSAVAIIMWYLIGLTATVIVLIVCAQMKNDKIISRIDKLQSNLEAEIHAKQIAAQYPDFFGKDSRPYNVIRLKDGDVTWEWVLKK